MAHAALLHQICDAVGDNAGFAGAGSGHDEKRTFGVQNGLLLGFVESLQDGRRRCVGTDCLRRVEVVFGQRRGIPVGR